MTSIYVQILGSRIFLAVMLLAVSGLGLWLLAGQAEGLDEAGETAGINWYQADDEVVEARIIARRADDGRIEFGMRVDQKNALPQRRFFPATGPNHGRWLESAELELEDGYLGQIIARRADDGRVEFGFRVEGHEDILPRARFFPSEGPDHNRWLRSSVSPIPRPVTTASSTDFDVDDFTGTSSVDEAESTEPEAASPDAQVTRLEKQALLAEMLYQYGADLVFTYNDYQACPVGSHPRASDEHYTNFCGEGEHPALPGYIGGHSGWDSYRESGGHRRHAFHSLTAGEIACLGSDYGLIAVKSDDGYITRYLHGEVDSDLYSGQQIALYDQLGITSGLGRGNRLEFGAHVHVEVAEPGTDPCDSSNGADDTGTIDPIDYLYPSVTASHER